MAYEDTVERLRKILDASPVGTDKTDTSPPESASVSFVSSESRPSPDVRSAFSTPPAPPAETPVRRVVVEYQLADTLPSAELVLLGAPGKGYEDAVNSLRSKYGDRLLNVWPHKGAKR